MNKNVMRLYRSAAAEELCRYDGACQELTTALASLERLRIELTKPEETRDHLAMMGFWESAVLRVTRVFEGKRPVPKALLDELPVGAHESLAYFQKLRNKHVAHRVNPVDQIKAGVIVRDSPNEDGKWVDGAGTLAMEAVAWADPTNVQALAELTIALRHHVAKLANAWCHSVIEEAEAAGLEQLRRLKPARVVVPHQSHLKSKDGVQ